MIVLLFGPPGSGKGTQATALSTALGVPHVATGDIFRKNLRDGTELGQLARSYMDRGALVPDSVTCDMVAARVTEPDCGLGTRAGAAVKGVLFDGFPRSTPQTEWLVRWLSERGHGIAGVVNLVVPAEVVVDRISGRQSCAACGATYHRVTAPTRVVGTCDRCGGVVSQRADDAEAVVVDRLRTYDSQTASALPVLRANAPVHDIDGVGGVDEVRARIFAALRLA